MFGLLFKQGAYQYFRRYIFMQLYAYFKVIRIQRNTCQLYKTYISGFNQQLQQKRLTDTLKDGEESLTEFRPLGSFLRCICRSRVTKELLQVSHLYFHCCFIFMVLLCTCFCIYFCRHLSIFLKLHYLIYVRICSGFFFCPFGSVSVCMCVWGGGWGWHVFLSGRSCYF